MSTKYNQCFKDSMVEKVLKRSPGVTIDDIVNQHNVSRASITRWIRETQQQKNTASMKPTQKEKRPQDWSRFERLQAIIHCGGLDEEVTNAYCRQQGIYPHHITQWKADFIDEGGKNRVCDQAQLKQLKVENKGLQKELRRKEKALAETAALLILKKKVQHLWENGEDNCL